MPAQAAPGDLSEGLGTFLGGEASGIDLDDIAEIQGAFAENPSGENPVVSNPLAAEVLNAVTVDLGDGLQLFGDNGVIELGAVNQYGEAQDNGDARAASGAVSDQGAIAVGGSEEFPADASLSLTPLLPAETEGLISQLDLELGALSSSAEQLDAGETVTDYDVVGAVLTLESPAVAAVYEDVQVIVADLQGALEGLDDDISGLLETQFAEVSANADLDSPDLTSLLPDAPVGESSGVVVDLTSGAVTVDLEALLAADPDLPNLNEMPANSSLLTGEVLAAIADGITLAITSTLEPLVENVEEAVSESALEVEVSFSALDTVDVLSVDLNGSLGEIQDGEGTLSVDVLSEDALDDLLSALGVESSEAVGDLVLELVGETLSGVFDILTGLEDTLDPVTGAIAIDVVGPLLAVVEGVAAVTVNVQPETGDLGSESTTVRAAQVTLLPASALAQVSLASSTVRGTDGGFDTSIEADPTEVEQGEDTLITGGGFAPNEEVVVSIPGADDDADTVEVTTETEADGSFSVTLPVPADYPLGEVTVTAVGEVSDTPATTVITVIEASDGDDDDDEGVEDDPSITADPSTVEQGDETLITGEGFAADETVSVRLPDAETVETTADEEGNFSVSLPIPADYELGDVDVTAVGDVSENPATTVITVIGADDGDDEGVEDDPSVTVDPDTASPGDTVVIGGDGFAPETTVTIVITDGDGTVVDTIEGVEVDGDGQFSVEWTVPEGIDPGDLTVTATDDNDPDSSASDVLTVVVSDDGDDEGVEDDPSVTVDPDTVSPGDTVVIGGDGFAPETTVTIVITDGDGTVVDTIEGVEVDGDGQFSVEWTVPEGIDPGDLTVTATDDNDPDSSGTATLTVTDPDEGAATAGTTTTGGPLATTGASIAGLAVAAGLALLLGTAIMIAGIRRRGHSV